MSEEIPEGWPMYCPMCKHEVAVEECSDQWAWSVDGQKVDVWICPDCLGLVQKESEQKVKDRIEAAKAGV